jgi:hypothetical protein
MEAKLLDQLIFVTAFARVWRPQEDTGKWPGYPDFLYAAPSNGHVRGFH